MILKVFCVLQLILIQVISAQTSIRDLVIQNVLNNLENKRLAECSRSRRQINNSPVDLPGTGSLPVQGFANGLPFKNERSFGNFDHGNGSPNNLVLNNGLPKSTFNMGLANSSPISSMLYPFSNTNKRPQNRLLPNGNNNNNNGLPINNIPNSLPSFNNVPNGLPGFNNMPNDLTPFNIIPNELTGFDNIPSRLPGVNNIPNGVPSLNNLPNGLPGFSNLPNGLPGFNDIPNGLPGFNNLPNGMPSFNNGPNGLSGLNNIPRRLPGFNNLPNGLPGFNNIPNGLPGFNNLPNGLPSFSNGPNGLPGLNNIPRGLPGVNNIPRAMPGFNIMQNPSNLPGINKFQTFINEPAGNILNSNNLLSANSLPNINNNIPITNSLTSFNSSPCGIAYPVPLKNRLPLNSLQSSNILPPINDKLPYVNNFQITEIGIGNGNADVNRFSRNNQLDSNVLSNANYLGNVIRLAHQGSNELANINGFSVMSNTPLDATEVSNNAHAHNMFSSINNFPNINGVSNFAGETENVNTMQLNNGMGDVNNFQNYNMMPVNEPRFVDNIPLNNDFGVANHIPANSRLINTITNGMQLSNGGYLNDILSANNAVNTQENVQNSDGNVFSSNNIYFDNVQVPVDNLHYETVGTKLPATQIVLPEGVHMFTNVPSEYQPGLMSNSLSLAKDLVGNLKIEGLDNLPFLNGLPVAGITETVTVLNRK